MQQHIRQCARLRQSFYFTCCSSSSSRSIFNLAHKFAAPFPKPKTTLSEDDLFHPLSSSPSPDLRLRAQLIKRSSFCPVCITHAHTSGNGQKRMLTPKPPIAFDCPDCGFPTHCSEDHWKADTEHHKYCHKLRQLNQDDHDLRSGRPLVEHDLPGAQGYEETVSFANWDIFWYTRGFRSMDTERMRRNASKILTYPLTIGSILHQHSYLTTQNQRLTPEGARSLAALRTTVHVPTGTPDTATSSINRPPIRIFILGARTESALPPIFWEQLCYLFPSAIFQIYFIGPHVALPGAKARPNHGREKNANNEVQDSKSTSKATRVYQPPVPIYLENGSSTRRLQSLTLSTGVPSYRLPYSPFLSLTALASNYTPQFHDELGPFDPYTDLFMLFSPGLGFSSFTTPNKLQISAPGEWNGVLPMLLSTRCPIFVTGFSPADVERDIRALDATEGVAGEFDWILMPGKNEFGSMKWEVGEFDVRVLVKLNWGLWGIRGKSREVQAKT